MVVQAGIGILDLINDPLVDTFILTLLEHHVLQHLKVFRHCGFMTINAVLQFGNDTNGFTALINHSESTRDLSHLQGVNGLGDFRWQILHTELR